MISPCCHVLLLSYFIQSEKSQPAIKHSENVNSQVSSPPVNNGVQFIKITHQPLVPSYSNRPKDLDESPIQHVQQIQQAKTAVMWDRDNEAAIRAANAAAAQAERVCCLLMFTFLSVVVILVVSACICVSPIVVDLTISPQSWVSRASCPSLPNTNWTIMSCVTS